MRVQKRTGVASIVGTVVFILVFMLAIGSLAYAAGLQSQTSAVQQREVQLESQRGEELLSFSLTDSQLYFTNEGPASALINHIILRFPNGTTYVSAASSTVPTGGKQGVAQLVPQGTCAPGTATCLSKYSQIIQGHPSGSSVGLVTSLGNAFWYAFQQSQVSWGQLTGFPPPCASGEAVQAVNSTLTCAAGESLSAWASASVVTSGTGKYSSTGMEVSLPANGTYGFYAFTIVEPGIGTEKYNFEIHSLSSGSSLVVACAPLSSPQGGGNQPTNCVSATGTPIATANNLGFGTAPPVYETPGIFGVVTAGPMGATLQIDIACVANCGTVNLKAGSFLVVQPLG